MKALQTFALAGAILLGAAGTAAALPATAFAEETESVCEGMKYSVADGAVSITGYTDELAAELTVPATIDGLPVSRIGEKAFQNCRLITEITLPDSITEIGAAAFKFCTKLEKATLPDTLTLLPENLFAEDSKLTAVNIPLNTQTIGRSAFEKCESLSELQIPASVSVICEDAFFATAWLLERRAESPFVIVNGILIDGKTAKGDITIPAEAERIGQGAFGYNQNIVNVILPANVKAIETCGFYYCPELKTITILNPQCDIFDLDSTISTSWARHVAGLEGGKIRGYADSTAEAFAAARGYPFELIYDPEAMPADLNCDGAVNAADAVLLSRYLAEDPEAQLPADAAADLDGDGALTLLDVRQLLKSL